MECKTWQSKGVPVARCSCCPMQQHQLKLLYTIHLAASLRALYSKHISLFPCASGGCCIMLHEPRLSACGRSGTSCCSCSFLGATPHWPQTLKAVSLSLSPILCFSLSLSCNFCLTRVVQMQITRRRRGKQRKGSRIRVETKIWDSTYV